MKAATVEVRGASIADPATEPTGRGTLRSRLVSIGGDLRRGYLQMFGIADYERYVAHHDKNHPEQPLLSRRQFHAQAIDRKYCRNGPRCC